MRLKPRVPRKVARSIKLNVRVKIVEGPEGLVGRSGVVIAETRNMLWVKTTGDNRKVIKIPKEQVVVMLEGGYLISGRSMIGDPAERLVRSYER